MSFNRESLSSEFGNGLAILLVAQFLSAYMGAYTEDTYAMYGASWTESLFYTHFLCLPFFLPLSPILQGQYSNLVSTPPLNVKQLMQTSSTFKSPLASIRNMPILRQAVERLPQGVLCLLINVITQLACISGVNLLCAKSSAVTVTIVLNIRKLVSFILSTILFGHQLSGMMVFGSTLVFGSGALYGYETSWRLPRQNKADEQANGSLKKTK